MRKEIENWWKQSEADFDGAKKNLQEIEPFIKKIKRAFQPEKIILFGSRAVGNDWKRSDYDFIIVSTKFKNVHWLKRIGNVVQHWDLLTDIDVLPYTPEEFKEKKRNSSTVRSAIKQGKVIAQ